MTSSALESLAASCAELRFADLVRPGVYVLLLSDAVQYVGESSNVLGRVGMHSRSFEFDRILFLAETNKRERRAIESALARRFAPPMGSVYSRKDIDRDQEILARFGLEPDHDNARIVAERMAACWPEESRRGVIEAAHERKRRRLSFERRYRVRWIRCWRTRGRKIAAFHLWSAVKPLLDSEARAS